MTGRAGRPFREGESRSVGPRAAEGSSGDRRIAIEVRDTGCGIPESLLPRLFEPYFSTKSGGTGLGLGLARRAIEEHGGTIVLRSRPGQGTVVTVTLPAAAAGADVLPLGGGASMRPWRSCCWFP